MALRLRRDTNALRLTVTLAEGEPFYATDKKQLWIGDGTTVGGILVGSFLYETVLGSITSGLITKAVHGIEKPSSVVVLNSGRAAVDVYYEIRANGDIYIESNVVLTNHILKVS